MTSEGLAMFLYPTLAGAAHCCNNTYHCSSVVAAPQVVRSQQRDYAVYHGIRGWLSLVLIRNCDTSTRETYNVADESFVATVH